MWPEVTRLNHREGTWTSARNYHHRLPYPRMIFDLTICSVLSSKTFALLKTNVDFFLFSAKQLFNFKNIHISQCISHQKLHKTHFILRHTVLLKGGSNFEKSSRVWYIFLKMIFCPKKENKFENVWLGKNAPWLPLKEAS